MAKRVKMKPWKGWCIVDEQGECISGAGYARMNPFDGDRLVRVLVTEIAPKRAKKKSKKK